MAEGDDEDESSKTEDPTAKRLSDAREQGNLPISRDFSTWFVLLGVVFCVAFLFPSMTEQLVNPMTAALTQAGQISIGPTDLTGILSEFMGAAFMPVLGVVFLLAFFGIASWIIQIGPTFNMGMLKIKWEKISPQEGIKRLFSMNSVVELLKSVGKLTLVGGVAYLYLKSDFDKSEMMSGMDNLGMVTITYDLAKEIIFAIFLAYTLIMLTDVFYQRYTYFQKMKMTKSAVKEEYRQSEGDPHVKSRLRNIRMEKARTRMMAAVPEADVIITNPTHFAIALKYNPVTTPAPIVLAKGQDFIAQKIREVAEAHDIPLVSNPPLARALYANVAIDEEIPTQHYRAVAEVISYIYRLRKKNPFSKK